MVNTRDFDPFFYKKRIETEDGEIQRFKEEEKSNSSQQNVSLFTRAIFHVNRKKRPLEKIDDTLLGLHEVTDKILQSNFLGVTARSDSLRNTEKYRNQDIISPISDFKKNIKYDILKSVTLKNVQTSTNFTLIPIIPTRPTTSSFSCQTEQQPTYPVSCQTEQKQTYPVSCQTEQKQTYPVSCQTEQQPTYPVSCQTEQKQTYPVSCQTEQTQTHPVSCQAEQQPLLNQLQELLDQISRNSNYKIDILVSDVSGFKSKISIDKFRENIKHHGGGDYLDCFKVPSTSSQTVSIVNQNFGIQTINTTVSSSTQTEDKTTSTATQVSVCTKETISQTTAVALTTSNTQTLVHKKNDSTSQTNLSTDSSCQTTNNSSVDSGIQTSPTYDVSTRYQTESKGTSSQTSLQTQDSLSQSSADESETKATLNGGASNKPVSDESPKSNLVSSSVSLHQEASLHSSLISVYHTCNSHQLNSFNSKSFEMQPAPDKSPFTLSSNDEFDISQLVNINSYGYLSLDHIIMMEMFGFDPRKSPFTPCGYNTGEHLPDDLNGMIIEDVVRSSIILERNEDDTFKEIGRGSYGVVYIGKMKNVSNKIVIKEFHNDAVCWEVVEQEAQILTYLNGKDITPNFLGILTPGLHARDYCLVQEHYGDGNLQCILHQYTLPTTTWIVICYNIAITLYHIHNNHILFNDLKSDNILVNLNNSEIRFIDYGMATFRRGLQLDGNPEHMTEYKFLAPEMREGCPSTPQSDIYSLGFLFGQIMVRADIHQLRPLWKSCTRIQATRRPGLLEIIDTLNNILIHCDREM